MEPNSARQPRHAVARTAADGRPRPPQPLTPQPLTPHPLTPHPLTPQPLARAQFSLSRRRLLAYGAAVTGVAATPTVPAVPSVPSVPFMSFASASPAAANASAAQDLGADEALATDLEERALALTPPAFLLESAVPQPIAAGPGSALSITSEHGSVCGRHALRWDHGPRTRLTVHAELAWAPDPYRTKPLADQAWQGTVDTFAVWIYNATAVDDVVRFEFGRGERTDCWFEFRLNFTGWRTTWVRYAYDMRGRPHPDMDTCRIIAPRRPGALWLDQLLLNVALRPDAPCRDAQVDHIGIEGDGWDQQHWQALHLFDRLLTRTPIETPTPTAAERAGLRTVLRRYHDDYLTGGPPVTDAYVAQLSEETAELTAGRAAFSFQSQIYPPEIGADLTAYVGAADLKEVTGLLRKIAQAYDTASTSTTAGVNTTTHTGTNRTINGTADNTHTVPDKSTHTASGTGHATALAELYLRIVRQLREQGWAYGSCQGTIHHLGFAMVGYYDSVFLMRDVLRDAGLLAAVRADLTWLVGFGRLRRGFDFRNGHGSTADILNMNVRGMLAVALLQDGEARRVGYLRALSDWLSRYLLPTDGIQDGLKIDGTTFHHVGFYPDYARDGFAGCSPIVYLLSRSPFRITTEAHQALRHAVLTLRIVANTLHWPIPLSGRKPEGTTGMSLTPYQWLTLAGPPDGHHDLDPEMGAAFLRLLPERPTGTQRKIAERLAAAGVRAEAAPTGAWAYNYAALVVQRRDEWQVTVRGHNRYLWSTEVYEGANWYGRYNTYGHLHVLHRGTPVTNRDSGFQHDGYDWNRRPGTTTLHKSWDDLKADLTGTIEEMLLTEERFAGGHTIDGRNGMFAMRLREHPTHDETHHARTSVFLFDNRVIALGTGIGNRDRHHQTETTLFQTHLATTNAPTYVGGPQPITAFPYQYPGHPLTSATWLLDDKGLGYYLPAGQHLALTRSTQHSRRHGNGAPTRGDFATAWLRHGTAPQGARYAYAMLIGATPASMAAFAQRMADPSTAPYTVHRADDGAHIVTDRATGITGYAAFEPTGGLDADDGPVHAVDTPALLLVRADGDGALALSVCDPDLRLYEGRDPDQYEGGRYVGHWTAYSRPWLTHPSAAHTLRVTLRGRWRVADADAGERCRATLRGGETVLAFRTVHGRPVQVRLLPA
ncbi:chondroitinase family polysaccharide lyase [Streptomyces zagrosensis]|uniref:Chondroitin-sulfate-ABC endolyase/exolyase n=1 Tax=Streptomyces zagrosensis TaxID=1042984 RepID=A0A7W9QC20_9ACTN|nr:chondroitinase family polysaccharide lyase [Streptomyces zagrosensis]MBB5937370.1 chondroitin-sulfate-ABC endolyase/exolyase [Streptomyces zagrosensis]